MHHIFTDFSPEQRVAVFKRLGVLNVWSPLFPTGDYEMDLADYDSRRVAEILFELDTTDEPGIETGMTLRGKKTEATSCLQPPGSPRAGDQLTHSLAVPTPGNRPFTSSNACNLPLFFRAIDL